MQSAFWTNTIWYLLLGVATVIEIIILFIKTDNKKLVMALFFTISGLSFGIEAAIMCFGKGYKYYPMIIPHLVLDDSIAGNFFSQFSITATALLLAVLNKKTYWYFIIAGTYIAIEEFFIKMGIFTHGWYRTWMTLVGFIVLFLLVKKIYDSSMICIKPVLLYLYVFFSFFTLYLITLMWIFKVNGIIDFNLKVFSDPMRSYAFLAIMNLLLISIPCMIIYFPKPGWGWKSVVFIALYVAVYAESRLNLIIIKSGWFFIYTTMEIFGTYLYVYMLDSLFASVRNCEKAGGK